MRTISTALILTLWLAGCGDKSDADDAAFEQGSSEGTGGEDSGAASGGSTGGGSGSGDGSDDTGPTPECDTSNEDCTNTDCDYQPTGPDMVPGASCLGCHTDGNMPTHLAPHSPLFTAAGTVFDAPWGDGGVADVEIRLTDSNGKVVRMTSGEAGNFYTDQAIAYPATAELEYAGVTKTMSVPVTKDGDCNACHQCDGEPGGKLSVD